jgi:succinate dehydrogenase / fumarate reductase flavoprotein subunit
METITFGRRAGQAAAEHGLVASEPTASEAPLADAERDLKTLLDRTEGERPWKIRDELGSSMLENFGVFRYAERMESQLEIIQALRERYQHVVVEDKGDVFNTDLTQALELGSMLDLAWTMVQAGIARTESRGAHSRPADFPDRDDANFLHHSITRWVDGAPELSSQAVRMTKYEPEVRSY